MMGISLTSVTASFYPDLATIHAYRLNKAVHLLNLLYQGALFEVGVASALKTLGYNLDACMHMRKAHKLRCIALIQHDRILTGR